MTRVNDAMRRLADLADFPVEPAVAPSDRTAGEPLPRESFAAETAAAADAVTPPRTAPDAAAEQPGSLFRRIHAELSEKVVVDQNMSSGSREQYRRLAAVLHDTQRMSGLQVVMIASALPGEGKTLTAANLALTFSESYRRRVLLIDADLRRPALQQIFRIDTTAGLIDGLTAPEWPTLVLHQVSPRLAVLPAGRPSADPMAGLTSPRMRRLIDEAKDAFDWIILDTPPLALLPDSHLLASMVDGTVLVIKANSTPFQAAQRAVESLTRARILGVVLNGATAAVSDYGAEHAEYYGPPAVAATASA